MPTTYKVLGQANGTTAVTNVYTVPAATQAVISTVVIANRSTSNTNYRIAVQPGGAALSNQHYIAYDSVVAGNDSIALSLGITMGNTDVLSVNASSNVLSFSVFGSEVT
ncbi:MAG: hypothetical protein EBU90_14960 [Proteobacteria bacterium]|nr:hypothetical protein [Pseudomonadota bacterium]